MAMRNSKKKPYLKATYIFFQTLMALTLVLSCNSKNNDALKHENEIAKDTSNNQELDSDKIPKKDLDSNDTQEPSSDRGKYEDEHSESGDDEEKSFEDAANNEDVSDDNKDDIGDTIEEEDEIIEGEEDSTEEDIEECPKLQECCGISNELFICHSDKCDSLKQSIVLSVSQEAYKCDKNNYCMEGWLPLLARQDENSEPSCYCFKECNNQTNGELPNNYYPCNTARDYCIDEAQIAKGLKHCHYYDLYCVDCFTHHQCMKEEYCDPETYTCKQGNIPNADSYRCENDSDCRASEEAKKWGLFYCLKSEKRCVNCVSSTQCEGACDSKTYRCFDPYLEPECDPPCPKGDGWYCWEDGKTAWCRQRGGYCEWCDILTECRHEDSVCWRPAGVPQEAGGYCFKKCASDADCKQFDQPDKPSICYEGVCLCGWM